MKLLIEFLKRFAPMLRSGKMSYSDALTRFRAQFGRPAEGIEKAAIMKEVEKAPSNIVQFPKERITPFHKPRPTEAELKAKFDKQNKETAERIRQRRYEEALKAEQDKMAKDPDYIPDIIDPEDFASGGIARVGMMIGGWTKAEVLINILKNTIKGSKDPWVKKHFPNWIKEIQKNPSLANNENVWKNLTTGLPKNQRLVVHSDDSVDFFTQSKFGPHNIEKTLEFQKKHNLSRDQANKILQMEPEDRVLEMKRLETIADKSRTKQAAGGIAGQLHLNQGGRVSFTKGGKVSSGLAQVLGV